MTRNRGWCWCVRAYQALTVSRPPCCRFRPTCSDYALDAFSSHPWYDACWLTLRRLLRCHPWSRRSTAWTYDPPPLPCRNLSRPDHDSKVSL